MATLAALVALLGAMFGGALLVDRWRANRLRRWAAAQGLSAVDRQADGGALIAHATRFSPRVRSFGLAFHHAAADDQIWVAEHRASLMSGRAERWHTLVVVRMPGATLAARGPATPDGWPFGGETAVDGEYVRWRRQGLLWPWNAGPTLTRGRALADYFLGIVQ